MTIHPKTTRFSILSIIAFIFLTCLTSCTGSNSVDAFLDSYEEAIVNYESKAADENFANGDIASILNFVNEANVANLKMANKADGLQEAEWSTKQQMRFMSLGMRFSQAMLKLSQQMQ